MELVDTFRPLPTWQGGKRGCGLLRLDGKDCRLESTKRLAGGPFSRGWLLEKVRRGGAGEKEEKGFPQTCMPKRIQKEEVYQNWGRGSTIGRGPIPPPRKKKLPSYCERWVGKQGKWARTRK